MPFLIAEKINSLCIVVMRHQRHDAGDIPLSPILDIAFVWQLQGSGMLSDFQARSRAARVEFWIANRRLAMLRRMCWIRHGIPEDLMKADERS